MRPASLDAVDRGIPRRLSAWPNDRFFDQGMVARMHDRVSVMLDGVELAEVTAWDVDEGVITRPLRDSKGANIISASGDPVFERLVGKVEVHWIRGMAPEPTGGAA